MKRWNWWSGGTLLGWTLVSIQGLFFLGIGFWPPAWGPALPASRAAGAVLFVAGSAVILAAAVGLRDALTPLPEPNGRGLAAHGVYRAVRHPMYTGVMLVGVAVAAARGSVVVWVLTLGLIAFFEIKTRREERLLIACYDGYKEYAQRTGKFMPGVGLLSVS